jgi:hypothetical protein
MDRLWSCCRHPIVFHHRDLHPKLLLRFSSGAGLPRHHYDIRGLSLFDPNIGTTYIGLDPPLPESAEVVKFLYLVHSGAVSRIRFDPIDPNLPSVLLPRSAAVVESQ